MTDEPKEDFGRIDFIRRFLADPCDAPFTAYAMTMAGAALEAFVTLYSLDPSNIATSALQSGAGINRGRSQKKGMKASKSRRWQKRGWVGKVTGFDPSSTIGYQLGKFSPLAKKPLPGPLGILFVIFGILDFSNFMFFLAEIITQFLYRFMSLLWNSPYCQARDDAVYLATGAPYIEASIAFEQPFNVPIVEKLRGPIDVNLSTFEIENGWGGIVAIAFQMQKVGDLGTTTAIVRLRKVGWITPFDQFEYTLPPTGLIDGGGTWNISSGGTYAVTLQLFDGFAEISSQEFYTHLQEPIKHPVP